MDLQHAEKDKWHTEMNKRRAEMVYSFAEINY